MVNERLDLELKERGLPELAFIANDDDPAPDATPVIAVRRGENGFYPVQTRLTADELNASSGVSSAQAQAMLTGSMMGWHVRGANPAVWEQIEAMAPQRLAARLARRRF